MRDWINQSGVGSRFFFFLQRRPNDADDEEKCLRWLCEDIQVHNQYTIERLFECIRLTSASAGWMLDSNRNLLKVSIAHDLIGNQMTKFLRSSDERLNSIEIVDYRNQIIGMCLLVSSYQMGSRPTLD